MPTIRLKRCISLACILTFNLNIPFAATATTVNRSTAVSQTYEGVHLSEAVQKASEGDGKLEDLLHWAIEHSDPTKLKQQAEGIGQGSPELSERQKEVQQLIKHMQSAPTETDLMKDAISVLTHDSTPVEELLIALEALQVLVEPIDNANNLHTLKGLTPVVNLLTHESPHLQAAAAYVLGTAASNNNHFHDQLMQIHPKSITFLMQVAQSSDSEASRKGLYALATLLRNNALARDCFYNGSGVLMLTKLLEEPKQSEPVQRKLLNLVTDLSQADLHTQTSKAARQELLTALHAQACDSTSSLAEEALLAVKGVLECSPADAKELAESSGTRTALHSMQQQLKSHLNSYAHVESYVVDSVQCERDLLQLCNDIDSMPILTENANTKVVIDDRQEL